jgi:hypothetical protein
MPLAGESAKSRARAHYRWGARYLREAEPQRASAHFGRAEHYMTMFGTQPAYSLGNEADWDLYSKKAVDARELGALPLQRLRKETDLLVADLKYTAEFLRDKVIEASQHRTSNRPDVASEQRAQNAANGLKAVTGIISRIDRLYDDNAREPDGGRKVEILNEIKRVALHGLDILQIANPDRMASDTLKKARIAQEESDSDDDEGSRPRKARVDKDDDGTLSGAMDKMQL